MLNDSITYVIRDDGTCSHCGRKAELIQLPDGDVTRSAFCRFCDEYNLEVLLIHKGQRRSPDESRSDA